MWCIVGQRAYYMYVLLVIVIVLQKKLSEELDNHRQLVESLELQLHETNG